MKEDIKNRKLIEESKKANKKEESRRGTSEFINEKKSNKSKKSGKSNSVQRETEIEEDHTLIEEERKEEDV